MIGSVYVGDDMVQFLVMEHGKGGGLQSYYTLSHNSGVAYTFSVKRWGVLQMQGLKASSDNADTYIPAPFI